jgi:hypothetical protein
MGIVKKVLRLKGISKNASTYYVLFDLTGQINASNKTSTL